MQGAAQPTLDERMNRNSEPVHWYASAAETYRAFAELGEVWSTVGKSSGRADVAAHGAELLTLAPQLYKQLHASLNKTVRSAGSAKCWPQSVEGIASASGGLSSSPSFRGFAELLYSGALTPQQVADIYDAASGSACGARLLVLGSPALSGGSISSPTAFGLGYGLLQHDMVERFLLHYFAMSAHGYTRGTFTAPEASNIADRNTAALPYNAAAEVIAPVYLKWMLVFEEPETRTLWLAKATPRDWLVAGEAPLVVKRATTRYGRVSFSLQVDYCKSCIKKYAVKANVTLPASFAKAATRPAGGLRLRLRAPTGQTGKLSEVSIGGKVWPMSGFSAADEMITITAEQLTAASLPDLQRIVATFS